MTLNDAFEKATIKDRRLTVYSDFENRKIAIAGYWYEDHVLDYREKHMIDPVELIGESMTSVTVALKEGKPWSHG